MQELILIRGLPGSGKSTLARNLSNIHDIAFRDPPNLEHYEADMFFGEGVNYTFIPERVPKAHAWCQMKVREALEEGQNVVVSNTFTRMFEMKPYIAMAREFGARLTVIKCEGQYGNVHNVPDEVIQKMKDRWEEYAP